MVSMEMQAPPAPESTQPPTTQSDPQPTTTQSASAPTTTPPASAPAPTQGTRRPWRRSGKSSATRPGYRLGELVWLCVAVVDAFLAVDFVFRAAAVSHDGFVGVVGRVGDSLASPFTGILRPSVSQVGHTIFWAAVLALVVYTLAAWVLARMIDVIGHPRRRQVSGI